MSRTLLGGVLAALGALVLVLSALADQIGLGSEGTSFGWKQIVGVAVGAVVLFVGAAVYSRARRESDTRPPASTP